MRILFVCHGNICRSPMAEFIMKDILAQRGIADRFEVASAATSSEEIWGGVGNPVYPPARKELAAHGIGVPGNELGVAEKQARKLVKEDYDRWDLLIGMERWNLRNMLRICEGDPKGKMSLLLDHTDRPADIDDPWYTRDFRAAYRQIRKGCLALLEELEGTR